MGGSSSISFLIDGLPRPRELTAVVVVRRQEQHQESAPVVCSVLPSIDRTRAKWRKVYATQLDKSKRHTLSQIEVREDVSIAFLWQLLLTLSQALFTEAFVEGGSQTLDYNREQHPETTGCRCSRPCVRTPVCNAPIVRLAEVPADCRERKGHGYACRPSNQRTA